MSGALIQRASEHGPVVRYKFVQSGIESKSYELRLFRTSVC